MRLRPLQVRFPSWSAPLIYLSMCHCCAAQHGQRTGSCSLTMSYLPSYIGDTAAVSGCDYKLHEQLAVCGTVMTATV